MRNQNLDRLKALSAYFVILIHVSLPGMAGESIKAVARFAVPVFFMISGYFCCKNYKKNWAVNLKKIKHVCKLMLCAFAFYLCWQPFWRILTGKEAASWFQRLIDGENIRRFLLYNRTSAIRAHLWFLPALLYCYVLYLLVERYRLERLACCLILILLFLHFYLEEGRIFTGTRYPVMLVRNYLFTGFPFFMLGYWIHRQQNKIGEILAKSWRNYFLWAVVLAGGILSITENQMFGGMELYLGSVLISVGLFLMAVLGEPRTTPVLPARIGSQYATFLYLFHPAVGDVLKEIGTMFGISQISLVQWLRPFAACVLVTLLAYLAAACRESPIHFKKNML